MIPDDLWQQETKDQKSDGVSRLANQGSSVEVYKLHGFSSSRDV